MKRRRRRASVNWIWAKQAQNQAVFGETGPADGSGGEIWLLPPTRVNNLLQYRTRNALTVKRTLLWLNTWFVNSSSAQVELALGTNFTLYIRKTKELNANGFSTASSAPNPYAEPPLPMNVGAAGGWDYQDDDADGTEPFLWSCPIFTASANTLLVLPAGNGTPLQYAPMVAAYQPTVDLRVRRRLQKDEGLALGYVFHGLGAYTGGDFYVNYATRILA